MGVQVCKILPPTAHGYRDCPQEHRGHFRHVRSEEDDQVLELRDHDHRVPDGAGHEEPLSPIGMWFLNKSLDWSNAIRALGSHADPAVVVSRSRWGDTQQDDATFRLDVLRGRQNPMAEDAPVTDSVVRGREQNGGIRISSQHGQQPQQYSGCRAPISWLKDNAFAIRVRRTSVHVLEVPVVHHDDRAHGRA
jgi:hypothetical protein